MMRRMIASLFVVFLRNVGSVKDREQVNKINNHKHEMVADPEGARGLSGTGAASCPHD